MLMHMVSILPVLDLAGELVTQHREISSKGLSQEPPEVPLDLTLVAKEGAKSLLKSL